MSLADVLSATTITGFSAAEKATIEAAITSTYNNSATARTMYENWVSGGNTISVSHVAGVFQAYPGTGRVEIDIPFISNLYYIDDNGNSVKYPFELALVHEFVHALEGLLDNYDAPDGDYRGDTVIFTNDIHDEMGYANRNSYISANFDTVIKPSFAYTGGVEIDRSFANDASWSATGNLFKGTLFSDDLLIGGASANVLEGNLGNDFLFGGGGDDTLNGGLGGTDTVVLSGKPVDYDIRLNPDGTWTSEHVRGAKDEGTDTFQNLERVRFADPDSTFNLVKSGLTWQTDFAFVIDQTGSMGDDIAAVKAAATGVVNALYADATIDARIGIVGFRDNTIGEPTSVILPFTDQDDFAARQAAAVGAINGISVSGGGDFPETAFDGLLTALDGSMGDWRVGAGVKKVALFTDASAKDAILLPAVLTYALSIGATITGSASAAFGEIATVDTFELTFGESIGAFPEGEGETLPPFVPSGDPIEPPGGTAIVQVTTIFIDTFISPDPNFQELADETGGAVVRASNPTEVVERLLEVITTTNYILTVDSGVVEEGDSGSTPIGFTISRDRSDSAATVTFETTGDASPADVSGAPATIDFDIGEVSKTFTVDVLGDTEVESDETFGLRITEVIGTGSASFSSVATSFVIEDDDGGGLNEVLGTEDSDALVGTDAADALRSLAGQYDRMSGGAEADQFIFGAETNNGVRERDVILDYEVGIDAIVLEAGASVAAVRETSSQVVVFLDGDRDAVYVRGDGVTADNITFVTDDIFDLT
ncbi:von Willebrand factor type A domain-containing protein [Rhodovulum sp. ES.010]|uniref:VWA domain-containing protein n=1 Tax=Rhodovulum sp. ES.010 TaxID=1882821 RepID=UPI00092A0D91|nr:VWA domain-containing protein [Rhodovulum sp. ES.010]SIO45953.1 von Willebrand factor type A domain-containing protein [Rhodovulum sp. ES.010]